MMISFSFFHKRYIGITGMSTVKCLRDNSHISSADAAHGRDFLKFMNGPCWHVRFWWL